MCALLELTLFAPVFCASSQRTCLRSFRISSESLKRDPSQTIRRRCSDVSQFPLRWFHSFRTGTVRNSAKSPTAAVINAQNRGSSRSAGGSLCLRAVRKVSGAVLLVCVRSRRRVKASRNPVNSSRRSSGSCLHLRLFLLFLLQDLCCSVAGARFQWSDKTSGARVWRQSRNYAELNFEKWQKCFSFTQSADCCF